MVRRAATGAGAGIDATDGNWLRDQLDDQRNTETGTQIDGGGAFISNAPLSSTWSNDTVSGNQAYSGAGLAVQRRHRERRRFDTIAGNTATSANTGGNLDVQSGSHAEPR